MHVNIATIVNKLDFSHFVHFPSSWKWGGLLFMWRPNLEVDLVDISSNILSMLVYSDPCHNPWLLNPVY